MHVPLWLKVAMFVAFFAILGLWAVLMRFVWYEWAPGWLVDVGFVALVGSLAYYFGYERGQRSAVNRDIIREHDFDRRPR